jgi:hypothetical protein
LVVLLTPHGGFIKRKRNPSATSDNSLAEARLGQDFSLLSP